MLKRLNTRYRKNTSGNVSVMFSIALMAVLLSIGAAVDYSAVSKEKQNLQDIVDAATLAAAKANSTDLKELEEIVAKVVAKNNVENWDIKLNVSIVDDMVQVNGASVYDTALMRIVGKPKLDVKVVSASPIAALTPVKLALVLDTTGSMSGDMTTLKQAASGLITELEKVNATAALSVVPFGQYVNVGTSKKGANWLDVTKDGTSETKEVCWPEQEIISPLVCTNTGRNITYDIVQDGRNMGQGSYPEQRCTGGETRLTGNTTCEMQTTSYTWNGCVGSRQTPYNRRASFGSTRIKGIMNTTCGTELLELTTSMANVRSRIQALAPAGSTYLPSGIMWGWRTLQDDAPLKTNVNLKKDGTRQAKTVKAMVFMTDGANTLSQGGGEDHWHNGSDAAAANAQTAALCKAAKQDGIQIFTVGYRMDAASADTRNLLKNCASVPTQYRDAKNAAELKKVFKDIVGQLDFSRLAI